MSEESQKTFTPKPQNKGEYQKPPHTGFKINHGPPNTSSYRHAAPHMINPMAASMSQAENTVNETNKTGAAFNASQQAPFAPKSVVKTSSGMPDSLLKKIQLATQLAEKAAAVKKAAEEAAAAKKAEEEAAIKKAEEEAAAKKAEESAAAKKVEEVAENKPEEEVAEKKAEEGSETSSEDSKKTFGAPAGSFASRFSKKSQENKKPNGFKSNSQGPPSPPRFVQQAGIPVSVWLDHMKNIPDDESKERVYTFDDIFELSQYNVVRDEVWHNRLVENRFFRNAHARYGDKKKSYNNDSKRGDRKNDSKRNKSKRNGDKYGNKYDNNYSKVPSKGLGLAHSEEEAAAAKKKAEEEEAERLANAPKIVTSEKGWKSKKKSQTQVVNIVTESGEEILSPDETEKQLKSLLNKLTAENYSSVSVKIINLMNQSRFKEDKMKSIPKTIEMTIFKGCDESQWGMIYARLVGDCMKHVHPDCLPIFKEYFLKAEKWKRYDLEDEWEEKGIPKSEWPPFEAEKAIESIPPHYAINYYLDTEMLKYDINGSSEDDIWNVKEGEEEDAVEMMSDEYYKAIGKKRRYLGLYKIIGYLYNINALQHEIINVRFFSLIKNIANASNKGVIKDDIIEALLEFVSTINEKYTAHCKAMNSQNNLKVTLELGNTLIKSKTISSRMIFKFEEYSEASLNNHSTNNNEIKSLEEVRAEAMKEIHRKKMEEKQKAQEYRNNSRQNKSNRTGRGFGSNRNQSFKNGNNNNNSGNWNSGSQADKNNGFKTEGKTASFRSASKKAEEAPKQTIQNAFAMLSNDDE